MSPDNMQPAMAPAGGPTPVPPMSAVPTAGAPSGYISDIRPPAPTSAPATGPTPQWLHTEVEPSTVTGASAAVAEPQAIPAPAPTPELAPAPPAPVAGNAPEQPSPQPVYTPDDVESHVQAIGASSAESINTSSGIDSTDSLNFVGQNMEAILNEPSPASAGSAADFGEPIVRADTAPTEMTAPAEPIAPVPAPEATAPPMPPIANTTPAQPMAAAVDSPQQNYHPPTPTMPMQDLSMPAVIATGSSAGSSKLKWLTNKYSLIALAVVLLAAGAWALYMTLGNNSNVADQEQKVATGAGEDRSDKSAAAPGAPVAIAISSLSLEADVEVVGLNSQGEIGAPSQNSLAAWYRDSSSPLDAIGNTFITGHIGSDVNPGVFYGLDRLKAGDEITLEMSDGQKYSYIVDSAESIGQGDIDMAAILGYKGADGRLLHIVTCAGEYDETSDTYTDRLVISAHEQ